MAWFSGSSVRIEGTAKPGYEAVQELFKHNVQSGMEECAQLCVYVGGEKVVDLWGTSTGNDSYGPETLHNVFSSGKSLSAVAMACLVDKGLLDYQEKVTKYWPEFGHNGKGEIRVCDVLRHEGGLPWIDKLFSWDDLTTESIKKNVVGEAIEEDELHFPPSAAGTKREYHAVTRGWVLNEIFRRIEPRGRTMGEYFREEICGPLNVKTFIGVKEEELSDFVNLNMWSTTNMVYQCTIPRLLGSKSEVGITELASMAYSMWTAKNNRPKLTPEEEAAKSTRKKRRTVQVAELGDGSNMKEFVEKFNSRGMRMSESSSCASSCTARGLAKIAASIANGGTIDGVTILGQDAITAMHKDFDRQRFHGLLKSNTSFSQGGVCKFQYIPDDTFGRANLLREGWVGWFGLGGSIMQWHPELNIGFGFVPSLMQFHDFANRRGARIQAEVVQCVQKLGHTGMSKM